ncbi:MAG TPA: DUF2272 domain-containing protein [Geminicoccaceae bacterium]|nr:DUF2272 domain-containing protein [Geminicoccaceae bacterium]
MPDRSRISSTGRRLRQRDSETGGAILMLMYVDAEALNLRSRPEVAADTRLALLHLCQQVDVLGRADEPGWVRVSAEIRHERVEGFVSEQFLRAPVDDAREALIAQAIREWLRFEKGLGREFNDPFAGFVGEMWQAIGIDLDGRDRDVPWSAAAISFMVRSAGDTFRQYRNFRFAAAHARYIHDSIVRRQAGDNDTPFWGFRLHERRPELGDMVCRWRETERDFDDAAVSDQFKSHCDIIVRVTTDEVFAIGGNVSHSVSITRYDKTQSGFLADTNNVFAHLVNRVA